MELRGIVFGDRYRLERRIAAGGMGQVWRAVDEVLGRPVAVKLLRPEYAEHPETLERFRAEARHAGALSHPHIAQVYDYGHSYESGYSSGYRSGDDYRDSRPFRQPYLVLEYVDGPSLAELIERGPLDADLTCDILAQAADGLAAAHRARLVHRDIKPGNMLLTSDGRVKVTDFGIAHAAGSAPVTAPGIVMGTALYMAPERISGGCGTSASDLYSLGVVMYECLSGRTPFRGTSADVMAAHLHLPLPALPDWVPDSLAELVARLTAKDPSYRIRDAAVLAARLRELEPVAVGAPSRQQDLPAGDRDLRAVPCQLADARPGGPVSPPAGYLSAPFTSGPDGEQAALPDAAEVPSRPGRLAATIPPARSDPTGEGHAPRAGAADGDMPAVTGLDVLIDAGAGDDGAAARPASESASRRVAPGARRDIRRRGVAAVVATAVVAGLAATGLAASGAFGAAPMAIQGATGPSATASPGAGYVQVPAGSLDGQQLATVIERLRSLGLTPKIAWADHTGKPTGTVISVMPNGPVPVGSTVIVTTAYHSATPPTVRIPGVPGTVPTTTGPSAGSPNSSKAGSGTSAGPGRGGSPGGSGGSASAGPSGSPGAGASGGPAPDPASGSTTTPSPVGSGSSPAPSPSGGGICLLRICL